MSSLEEVLGRGPKTLISFYVKVCDKINHTWITMIWTVKLHPNTLPEQTYTSSVTHSTGWWKKTLPNRLQVLFGLLFEIISLMMWDVRLNPWIMVDISFTLIYTCTFYHKWQCNYISSRWNKLKLRATQWNCTVHMAVFSSLIFEMSVQSRPRLCA